MNTHLSIMLLFAAISIGCSARHYSVDVTVSNAKNVTIGAFINHGFTAKNEAGWSQDLIHLVNTNGTWSRASYSEGPEWAFTGAEQSGLNPDTWLGVLSYRGKQRWSGQNLVLFVPVPTNDTDETAQFTFKLY